MTNEEIIVELNAIVKETISGLCQDKLKYLIRQLSPPKPTFKMGDFVVEIYQGKIYKVGKVEYNNGICYGLYGLPAQIGFINLPEHSLMGIDEFIKMFRVQNGQS